MRFLSPQRLLLLALTLLVCSVPGQAQQARPPRPAQPLEQILDFHTDITLEEDASLKVTETVAVVSTGSQIRHGIFRRFPTRYHDTFNNKYVVGFQMRSATCDDADTPFRVENDANGKRIYLGDAHALVRPGRHVYTLTYTTNRQLGFFRDHDELFWNVTGLGWDFPIQHASATVHLPAAIPAEQVNLSGYTGPEGSREAALTTERQNSAFDFVATRPFRAHEGLTILVTFPKGFFAEPTQAQKLGLFFRDNRDALLLAAGSLVMLVYYLVAWSAVGRDPVRGVIMALYQPPQNLSPAALRYLERMGFDNKTFAAALLDMAVRGFLTIKQQDDTYALYLTGKDNSALTPDEKQVATFLFEGRSEIWLRRENHQSIQAALQALKKWLAYTEQKTYFVTNSRYLIPPVILSAIIVLAYLLALGGPQVAAGAFLSLWLTIWTMAVGGLLGNVVNTWRGVLYPHRSALAEVADTGKALVTTLFAMPFLLGEVMGFFFLLKMTSFALVLFVLASGGLHVLFLYLLKAPTFAGRRLMDQVEGFKMFLGAVDGDRLNRTAPAEQTPAVFEKFLPYALALDVEQAWANQFSGVLAGVGAPGGNGTPTYTPSFFSGGSSNGFTNFASSFGTSLTSAISSSATAPGSAGGSGGGSGGGGGGGGGGGW